MRSEILGVEPGFVSRRRWSDEQKLEIVGLAGTGSLTVTDVAQRYGITRQQIYSWRRQLKKRGVWGSGGARFLPVEMSVIVDRHGGMKGDRPSPPVLVELRLREGRSLHFDEAIDSTALTRLIRAVEAA